MQFQCKILSCIHSGSKFWNIRLMKCWIHIYHHINRYGFKYIFKWSAWLPWFSLFYHESSSTSHAKIKKYIVTPQDTPPDPPKMIIQITNLKRHRCRITHIIANKKHPPATTYPFIIQSPFLHKKRAFRL